MPVIDDGYVKYVAERTPGDLAWTDSVNTLDLVRTELFELGLIGIYPNGIGYGNLSVRESGDRFLVTGTGTGSLRRLGPEHWCRVDWFSLRENRVRSFGPVDASSESMTHGAIYQAVPGANCVIHVHGRDLFDRMLSSGAPRTAPDIAFGTPEMALAVVELARSFPVGEASIFAMAGHDEGVVAFGPDIESTRNLIIETSQQARK